MHLQTSFTLAMSELSKVKIAKKNEEEEKEKMGESVFFFFWKMGRPYHFGLPLGNAIKRQKNQGRHEEVKKNFFPLGLPIVPNAH